MRGRLTRRSFLKRGFLGLMGAALGGNRLAVGATAGPSPMHVICLFMNGGPAQTDTFDPKPNHVNGGPFRAIRTSVPGVLFSENLPLLAERAHRLTLIRSMTTREGTHARARRLMRTGCVPTDPTSRNSLLSTAPHPCGSDLPSGIVLNSSAFDARSYGTLSDVWYLPDPIAGVESIEPVTDDMAQCPPGASLTNALDLDEEPSSIRRAYGMTGFGQGCLLARRLVDAGVSWVEVVLDGWDAHQDHATQVERLSAILDPAMATLLDDLNRRDLLDSTLVMWMGEFGRSPRINDRDGRDHWPDGWTVALAGGRLRGGRVIGATDASGERIVAQPVSAAAFFAFVRKLVRMDATAVAPFPIA